MSSEDYRLEEARAQLVRYINQKLIVRQLNQILKSLALPVSGLKPALIARLVERIDTIVRNKDVTGFENIKRLVNNPDTIVPSRPSSMTATPTPRSYVPGGGMNGASGSGYNNSNRAVQAPAALHFRKSPFFVIQEALSAVQPMQIMSTGRNQVHTTFRPSSQQIGHVQESGYRCMMYCTAGATNIGDFSQVDVEFPAQIEVRVNQKVVQGKMKGLKNKPGTTHPLDITDYMFTDGRLAQGYTNVTVTYALNQKPFSYIINLVQKHPPSELAEDIRLGKYISRETVLERMRKTQEDNDIVATSTVLSLKCPLSTLRLKIPIRSIQCRHNQCFDALSFLQLQEQAPTWNCPVCNNRVAFEQLVVDQYVQDILNRVPGNCESVTVDPLGNWEIPIRTAVSPPPSDSDEEDDLIEIKDESPPPRYLSKPQSISLTGMSTPVSREQSTSAASMSRPNGGASNKRPQSTVIDLTLSDGDDEDESPRPPPKRHQTSSISSSNARIMTPTNQSQYGATPPQRMLESISSGSIGNRTSTPQLPQQQTNGLGPGNSHSQFYLDALLKYREF